MRSVIPVSPFLRLVLRVDAAASAASGLLMALAAPWLDGPLRLPPALLVPAGLALLPWAAFLAWLARRDRAPRAALVVPIVVNVAWAADCAFVALGSAFAPSALGQAFVALQALVVLAFAALQGLGLRRAAGASAL